MDRADWVVFGDAGRRRILPSRAAGAQIPSQEAVTEAAAAVVANREAETDTGRVPAAPGTFPREPGAWLRADESGRSTLRHAPLRWATDRGSVTVIRGRNSHRLGGGLWSCRGTPEHLDHPAAKSAARLGLDGGHGVGCGVSHLSRRRHRRRRHRGRARRRGLGGGARLGTRGLSRRFGAGGRGLGFFAGLGGGGVAGESSSRSSAYSGRSV